MNSSISQTQEAKILPAELLQMYRKRARLSQARLAKLIGLQSKRMVQSWEVGYSLPRSERLKLLIEFYLKEQVFIKGQESEEARRLWNNIKEFFDATSSNLAAYPVFDTKWFELTYQLINRPNSLPAEERAVAGPGSQERSALTSPPSVNNLPALPNRLVGREKELGELYDLIVKDKRQLVTLLGTAGAGKTRLALEVAHRLLKEGDFADGLCWVELSAIRDPQLVIATIAHTLNLTELVTSADPLSGLITYLTDKKILLVLDNFEQVVASARSIGELLSGRAGLQILVTSRTNLRLYVEQEYQVPGLSLPDQAIQNWSLEELSRYEAVQLLVSRAKLVRADFNLTNANLNAIAEICWRLDGLPLALELAAVRLKILSPQALLEQLNDKLSLLRGGPIDKDQRHQTLRAALDWSYDLLSELEKQLFCRLGVFDHGFTLEAALAICADLLPSQQSDHQSWLLAYLHQLVDHSLLQPITNYNIVLLDAPNKLLTRFKMLETVREYALAQLVQAQELDLARQRHLAYFVELAEEAEPKIRQMEQVGWLELLEIEHPNLRAALAFGYENHSWEQALRLAGALWWFWYVRGYWQEGLGWLETGWPDGSLPLEVRAKAVHAKAGLSYYLGKYEQARTFFEEALSLRRLQADKTAISVCLHNLGVIANHQSDYAQALKFHTESLNLKQALGYKWGIAHSLDELGTTAYLQGDYPQALNLLSQSRRLFEEVGDTHSLGCVLNSLGKIQLYLGRYTAAESFFKEGLHLCEQVNNQEVWATILNDWSLSLLLRGEPDAAKTRLEESRSLFTRIDYKFG